VALRIHDRQRVGNRMIKQCVLASLLVPALAFPARAQQ
jgi:hypothetical protein